MATTEVVMEEMLTGQERLRETKLNRFKKKMSQDPNYAINAGNIIFKKLVDDVTMEIIGEFYRAHSLGYSDYLFYPSDDSNEANLNQCNETESEKKPEDIKCPNCARAIGATRFAPHLDSCLGGGSRNSSRLANKRIASSSRGNMYGSVPTDDEDEEWNMSNEKPTKPSKKSENSKRNKKHLKSKSTTPTKANQNSTIDESNSTISKIKTLPVEERLAFLSTNCGAKVDSTTLCLKPPKCKSHTDTERTVTRKLLSSSLLDGVASGNFINIQDLDLPSLDNEMENGVTLSPADSSSSVSSTSSYKRKSK